jgi:GTP cyclohydrolase I
MTLYPQRKEGFAMKTRHHILIRSTCPVNGDADFYACFIYVADRVLPYEEVADAVDKLTRAPVYQEVLTQQLAVQLHCKVKTVGRHAAGKVETTVVCRPSRDRRAGKRS